MAGSDLSSFMDGLGIDPSMLQLGAGGGSDEDSMQVYKGTKKVPRQTQVMADARDGSGEVPAFPARTRDSGEFDDADDTDTVGNFKKEFHRRPPGELSKLQRRLWEGGFYDRSLDWEDIRQNDYDEDSRQAWERAVARAAAFYDADQKLTIDQVIDMAALNRSENDKNGTGGSGRGGRTPLSVTLTHPDDIRTTAMKVSAATLGKGWGEEQLSRFIQTFQQMERAAQSGQHAAREGGGTATGDPNMAMAVERAARASDPTAAGATDVVSAYGQILDSFKRLGAGAK